MKPWKRTVMIAAAGFIMLASGYATAQDQQKSEQKPAVQEKGSSATPGQPKEKMTRQQRFDVLDADKDGKVSAEEFKANLLKQIAKLDERFKKRDKDGDGYLTKEELGIGKGKAQ